MNAKNWVNWFEKNRFGYDEPDWTQECQLESRELLAKSLAVFQLGESGGGTRLRRWAESEPETYQLAVELFIAEEQRHADLLERVVTYLGGELRTKQWTNSVFRGLRSAIGLEFNIQILLTAELIAEAFYGLLHTEVDDPVIKSVCGKIVRDEVQHIAFHVDFYRHRHRIERRSPFLVGIWTWQFRAVFALVQQVVWWDHGEALQSIGVTRRHFLRRSWGACESFLQRVNRGLAEEGEIPATAIDLV